MKVQTLIHKLFGKNSITDMMDAKHEDDEAVEYFAIDANEDDSEPSYFVRVFAGGLHEVTDINSKVLISTTDEKKIKVQIKALAAIAISNNL